MPNDALIVCQKCGRSTPADSERCDQCGARISAGTPRGSLRRQTSLQMRKEWIIGSDAELCQIHVDRPTVSRRHCALRLRDGAYYLEDLGSSNRTFVNGEAIYGEVGVTREDRITLGKNVDVAKYWPDEPVSRRPRLTTTIATRTVLSIGRGPQNDIVLNRPRVSWTHAELASEKGEWTLTDVGSTHGTAVGNPDNKIHREVVSLDDIVYFGEFGPGHGWPVRQLLSGRAGKMLEELKLSKTRTIVGRDPKCDIVLDHPSISKQHAELIREGSRTYVRDLGSLNGTFVSGQPVSGMMPVPPNGVVALGIYTLVLTDGGTIEKSEYNGDFVLSVEGLAVRVADKRLLEDVSFTFLPQEMVALMGGSGAGKTTLLKALCGYTRPNAGQILYNGQDLYANYGQFRHLIGYVPQDDIVHAELTVQEALLFTVMLRTGQDEAAAVKDVESVLRKLQLWDIKDQIIGSSMNKVISGGQRKRVNIAMELLCRPSCLFLDEPTSGLSSLDAEMVVGVLKTLAVEGKTVVMTIHQPSREVFEMFSALVMLQRDKAQGGRWIPGRRVYFGPAYPDSIEFFNPEGVAERRNSGNQPGPELLFEEIEKESAEVWEKRYLRSKYRTLFIDDRRDVDRKTNPPSVPPPRQPLWQASLLVRRNVLLKFRDPMQRSFLALQPVLFGLLVALLFHDFQDPLHNYADPSEYENFRHRQATIHFLMAIAAVWFGCNNAVREIVGELPIYIRERMACLAPRNYLLSKYVFLAGLCLLQCLAMLLIVQFTCRLQGSFWFYLGMTWLTSLVGVSIGLAVSALAGLYKTPEAAVAALPLILLPMILLGGGVYPLYQLEDNSRVGGVPVSRVISSLAPTRWLFEADFVAEAEARCAQIRGLNRGADKRRETTINHLELNCDEPYAPEVQSPPPQSPSPEQARMAARAALDKDLASRHFLTDTNHKRSGTATCIAWLVGLFTTFLILTFGLLRWIEEREVG